MADEHVLVYEFSPAIPFTVTDATAVPKGTLMENEDLMVAGAAEEDDRIAGVAAEEKIASDGHVHLGIYMDGIFRAKISGAVNVGDAVAASGSNIIKVAAAANVGSETLGYALETGADTETILYRLMPACNNTAYS